MDLIKQIRWQDILDILLVWIVLYRLLLIIKGTRAIQMLAGLGVLLVASVVSRYLKLFTMDWLIQSFWAYIVIALIVLFQPEIRRALAQMGEAPFLPFASAEELKSLEEIIRATLSLSVRKTGALIVIERFTSLKDFIEIGTHLDSRVSRELILSIFHTTSPIHDGAIIIKGNRIVAAGCFLPISLRTDLDKDVGTRHRAALAITEETDSAAIVISEETGKISIAIGGNLEKQLTIERLRLILTDLFTETKKRQK